MSIKSMLIIQALLLVGAPMAAYIISPFHFVYSDFTLIIFPVIPLSMVFFGTLFTIYFMRVKMGNLTAINLLIKWGIYLSIAFFILLMLADVYYALPLITVEDGYLAQYLQHYFWAANYLSLILIALMFVALRLNKSIASANTAAVPVNTTGE